jgi:cyclohexanecarboxylate-CoA ligase
MNDVYRSAGWWRDETILDDLRRAVSATPDKTALVCYQGSETGTFGPVSLTYRELGDKVERIAGNLHRLGVRHGDVVTLQLPNNWQLVALILACARIGAVAGPVVPIMRRREVEFTTRLTGSPVYIASATFRKFDYAEMSAEVAAAVPTLRHRILLGGTGSDGALDFDRELLERESSLDGAVEAGPDDLAQVMFTSGTTGEPKGVVHSHNTLYSMNKAQADVLHLSASEVTAMGSPTTHQAGYTWNLVMPLLLGATSVHVDHWDARVMLKILQEQRVTFFMGAPPFLSDLVNWQKETPYDLSALHTFCTGSAPIAPLLVEQARDVLGCRLYALWGMTENGCVTITRPEEPVMRAAESDGTAVDGMEVRIVDRESGGPVRSGQAGLLQVRGSQQCLGYYRREDVYAKCVTDDGWFDTGDLARDDGHGGIRITGRVKDLIMRGAENIPAIEVEAALLRHEAVRDVAVVGYPDERLGERACAVLVTGGATLTMDDVQSHLDGLGMAKHYWPERLEFASALPRTPSGKIQKFALRDQIRAQ